MLANYLKVALRTLRKHRGYTLINLLGLAVGLACAVLLFRYAAFELHFDRFHANAERIYRVVQQQPGNTFLGSDHFAVTPVPLAGALVGEFPEVEAATAFDTGSSLLSAGDRHFYEEGVRADAAFFQVFSFPLLRGDPATALAEPNTIVLTAALAKRLFGDEDPVGKTILVENRDAFTVTAVAQDVPANSHITFAYATSLVSDENYAENLDSWGNSSVYTYFVLRDGARPASVEAKLVALVEKHRDEPGDDPRELPRLYLQPLASIHLHSHINFDIGADGDIRYVYLFAAIGVVILLLACINYTNLAVARSMRRAKEIGMRKVVGASRAQLVVQYLGESVLMAGLATGLGLAMAHLALPVFEHWVERDLTLDYTSWRFVLGLGGLTLLVGLLAGAYPALLLTALRPSAVLKGGPERRFGRSRLRSVLVVGQYTAAIALGIGSLVIYKQLHYMRQRDPGYDREHVVAVRMRDPQLRRDLEALKAELRRGPHVTAVSTTTHLPLNVTSSTTVKSWEGSAAEDEARLYQLGVDYGFLDVFGIELAAGRFFSPDHPADTAGAYVLNETAVRRLGWGSPEDAVGKRFSRSDAPGTVVGVVKDFHLHSFHQPIAPLYLYLGPRRGGYLSLRLRPDDLPASLAYVEQTMKRFSPYPVEYEFLDEAFDRLYHTEQRLGRSFAYFTLIALLIASLGLVGLAAYAAEQRTKEIGVRKVLGASVPHLITLLSKQFAALVLVAFTLAVPIAYFFMDAWLRDFSYRITLSWPTFAAAGLAAFAVALLTVGYQATRAALADPVKALRYE